MGGGGTKGRPPVRLLLLGPGGVGKSTLFRQIKLHKADGFSTADLQEGATAIREMLKSTLRTLVRDETVLSALSEEARELCEDALLDLRDLDSTGDQQKLYGVIKSYWQNDAVRKAIKKVKASDDTVGDIVLSNEWIQFWIDDSERVLAPGYVPTGEDMLKLRRPTSGVRELNFAMDLKGDGNSRDFCLVDVGGQVHEMKTWDSELQKPVGGVVFMVSLADYCKTGMDSNRLMESFTLLDDILRQTPVLQNTPLVVLMNKVDLFNERIKNGSNFRKYIRECPKDVSAVTTSKSKNEETAARVVEWLTEQIEKKTTFVSCPHGQLTSFTTCATDTTMAETMIQQLVDAVLSQSLSDGGFLDED